MEEKLLESGLASPVDDAAMEEATGGYVPESEEYQMWLSEQMRKKMRE